MKKQIVLIPYFFIILSSLYGNEFDNRYNHYAKNQIKRFVICGERCSGTNFLYHIIARNFPHLVYAAGFGTTHAFWWFNQPIDHKKLQRIKYSSKAVSLSESEDCLFIFIIRNPYDWLRSFYLSPYQVHKDLLSRGFFHFISSEWKSTSDYDYPQAEIDNSNPITNKPFSNVLELRKYKILNSLNIRNLVENYLFVRYEDVAKNPEKFINFIAQFYNMRKNMQFIPVNTYKGVGIPYKKKNYFRLSKRTMHFINSQLDWSVEQLVGYKINSSNSYFK